MSLLNAVVGALAGAQGGGQGAGGAVDPLGGLGALLGGVGGAGGAGGGAMPALLQAVVAMLGAGGATSSGAGGAAGGLAGLVAQFQQAGLGDQVASWISTGRNLPVSAEQVQSALGADTLGTLARQAGIGAGGAGPLLAQLLPVLVDQLTPNGQLPAGGAGAGAGGLDDLLGGLGGLLRR